MTQKAKIFYRNRLAGYLERYEAGYRFSYEKAYLREAEARPVSLTLPLSEYSYTSRILFPFFDGLIPEGWLLNIARQNLNLKETDRFELLVTLCRDTIGPVTVVPDGEDADE